MTDRTQQAAREIMKIRTVPESGSVKQNLSIHAKRGKCEWCYWESPLSECIHPDSGKDSFWKKDSKKCWKNKADKQYEKAGKL